MKIRQGVNPDFADFDEIDQDVEDAIAEFEAGYLTVEELKHHIGPEAVERFLELEEEREDSFEGLFDDPEDY